ncbi:hypothetical protein Tco_1162150 [Tanacetum coccineum]
MWWIYGLPTWQSLFLGGEDSGEEGGGLSMVELKVYGDGGVGYDDDGDGEVAVMVVLAAVGQQPERRGREKNASEGEWCRWSGRSGDEEAF